ncbi:PilN domain-containing protein [Pseudomonas xanthosomatis]|uniref:PilN domain-containing protein n=1 Tax=Pseudomonas xanthosomatis TaxID=2842356 RepID=UPI001C3DB5A1|nr:PilN domain-containing protein [Pseudomonas xanthosomatis]QXH47036.1 PilN domain-containing protein [Pseudomonas xanthosomatis]
MVRLNLMPWRERRRAQVLRHFCMMLVGSCVLALAGLLLLDQLARARLAQQVAATALYQVQLNHFDSQQLTVTELRNEREALQQQQAALMQLRAGQATLVSLFQGLEKAMPDGARFTELNLENGRLRLAGLAASAAVVAQLMRDLEAMQVLSGLELVFLRHEAAGDAFLITAELSAGWS